MGLTNFRGLRDFGPCRHHVGTSWREGKERLAADLSTSQSASSRARGEGGCGELGTHPLQLPRPGRCGDSGARHQVMFIAPMNAPDVKLICRASYEMTASLAGTPFDYPLSSRFDENDAIFVFDNVL